MVNILKCLKLFAYFVKTEIIGAVELIIWLAIKENDFYKELWNTDYVRPAMTLALIAIPVISAISDYHQNKKNIAIILREIWK